MTDKPNTAPTLADLRARRDDILRAAAQYGAYNVRVFGSVARGDATEGSDVDLVVQFQDWVSLYELSGLKQHLEALLGRSVDIADSETQKRRFLERIAKDVVAL